MLEFPILGILAVFHAQQRLCQTILAIHDLRQKVAFDAIEAPIHFGLGIALGRNHPVVLDGHHHAAAGTTEAAGRLGPFHGSATTRLRALLRDGVDGNACHSARGGGGSLTNEIATGASHGRLPR